MAGSPEQAGGRRRSRSPRLHPVFGCAYRSRDGIRPAGRTLRTERAEFLLCGPKRNPQARAGIVGPGRAETGRGEPGVCQRSHESGVHVVRRFPEGASDHLASGQPGPGGIRGGLHSAGPDVQGRNRLGGGTGQAPEQAGAGLLKVQYSHSSILKVYFSLLRYI